MTARGISTRRRSLALFLITFSLLTLSLVFLLASPCGAVHDYKARGRWTTVKSDQWGTASAPGSGTHVALVRGNGDSSYVVHWHDEETNAFGTRQR